MKQIYILSIFLACFLLPTTICAQNDAAFQQQADSLRKVVAVTEGKEKLDTYQRLTDLYWDDITDDETLNAYMSVANEYEKEAKKQNYVDGQIILKGNLTVIAGIMGRFDEMAKQALENVQFIKSFNEDKYKYLSYKYLPHAYDNLVYAYCEEGKFEKALLELQTLFNESKVEQNPASLYAAQYLTGQVYMFQDRYGVAADYYRQSIETGKNGIKNPKTIEGVTMNDVINLRSGYFGLCNALIASECFDDELFAIMKEYEAFADKTGSNDDRIDVATQYLHLYVRMKDWDKAEIYCNRIDSLDPGLQALCNTAPVRADIAFARGEYPEALKWNSMSIELRPALIAYYREKVKILSRLENAPRTFAAYEEAIQMDDSLRNVNLNAQLDELRTQYEVDKHIAEKERNRNYFLFALGGCILLAIALGIWIYYNRKVTRKNRALVGQIQELQAEQEIKNQQLLQKTTFSTDILHTPTTDAGAICPESRKDKLCLALRDLLLKDKIYRDETLSRDSLIERLGINRYDLEEAFMFCFNTQYADYINLLRINDSIVLLKESDLSMEEISEKIGYGTVRTFQMQFRKKYDMSPREYRKLAQS